MSSGRNNPAWYRTIHQNDSRAPQSVESFLKGAPLHHQNADDGQECGKNLSWTGVAD